MHRYVNAFSKVYVIDVKPSSPEISEARIGNVGLNLRRLLRTFSNLRRSRFSMSKDILFHGQEIDNRLSVVVFPYEKRKLLWIFFQVVL